MGHSVCASAPAARPVQPALTAEAPALSAVPAPAVDDVPAGTHGTFVLEGLPLLRRPEATPVRTAAPLPRFV